MDGLGKLNANQMIWTTAESKGENLDPVKLVQAPPPPQYSITDRSKAVLLLWFLYVTCYVCMYMVFSNMVNGITVAHYASYFVIQNRK